MALRSAARAAHVFILCLWFESSSASIAAGFLLSTRSRSTTSSTHQRPHANSCPAEKLNSSSSSSSKGFYNKYKSYESISNLLRLLALDDNNIETSDEVQNNSANDNEQNIQSKYLIERVSSKKRAFDVRVFRKWSPPLEDYLMQQSTETGTQCTEEEAFDKLIPSIDENGRDTAILFEPLVQFVAVRVVCNANDEEGEDDEFKATNGVVGTVDAQLQLPNDASDDFLPWPHVHLKNLAVDERVRRQGIASALTAAVADYASELQASAVLLIVDQENNPGAVRLYEKEGFQFRERTDGDGTMVAIL